MSDILLTGGAGFIGSHLTKLLLQHGHAVRILDNLSPQIHGEAQTPPPHLNDPRVQFIRGSVTSREDMTRALEGVRAVVHLAAETGTGQSMYEIENYYKVNCLGTALLMDILVNNRSHNVQRIVLASSRSVYGEGPYVCTKAGCEMAVHHQQFPAARSIHNLKAAKWDPVCSHCQSALKPVATQEQNPTNPASIYAATKLAQEDTIRIGCQSNGIGYAILRLQNVYGEGQSLKNPYTGIISIFSTKARKDEEIPVFEDGMESRDFVHVSDVVEVMRRVLTSETSVDTTVNVGSGVCTSIQRVAELLIHSLQSKSQTRVTGEFRVGDIRHNFADVGRLGKVIDFAQMTPIETGMGKFADWVITQPLPEEKLAEANAQLRARKLMG